MKKMKLNIQMFASNGCTITVVSCTPSSTSDNYSTIKIHGKLTTGGSSYNYGGAYMQPTINNQPVIGSQTSSQTLSKKKYSIGPNGTKEDDWTFKVYHNDNGTCNNLTIKIKWYISDSTNGTATYSGGYTPATIARASDLTATDGTLNSSNSVSITITRKNNTFTHTLRYVCGTASGWIKDSNNKVATSATWTPPLSLASQNQSGSSISCRIYCQTYDGNTTVGSETYKDITLTIPTLNPTASLSSISDNTSYKSTYGVFIQNKSKIKATLSGTAQYSTINTYNWEIRQTNSSGNLLASGSNTSINYTPTTSGTLYIKGTVTDKRGATNSTSTTVSITAYSIPKCSLAVSRTGDTTASYTMRGSGSPISQSGYTANTVTYLLKRSSTQIRSTNNGASYTGTDSGITANNSYTYTLTATDTISGTTDTKTVSISTTFTLMNFSATGYGLSIGKASEVTGTTKLFEVDIPAKFNSTLTGTLSGNATSATNATTATNANNVALTQTEPTDWTNYRMAFVDGLTGNRVIRTTHGVYVISRKGTTSVEGVGGIILGNSTATGTDNNKTGRLRMYGEGAAYVDIVPNNISSSNKTLTIPNKNGTITLEPVSLYNNSSGTEGNITLSETSANFTYLEIFYFWKDDLACSSEKVYSPNGKTLRLTSSYDNGTYIYITTATYTISGTSLTINSAIRWRFRTDGNATRTTDADNIKIYKVIGYR